MYKTPLVGSASCCGCWSNSCVVSSSVNGHWFCWKAIWW